jgi:hypothetical protein
MGEAFLFAAQCRTIELTFEVEAWGVDFDSNGISALSAAYRSRRQATFDGSRPLGRLLR